MKLIDRYIFKTFLQTFLVLLVIWTFIMLLQVVWLYVEEFAGKDLEFAVFVKFIIYAIPTTVPLTIPLSILLSSIMVFGDFSAHYEFAAMKSSGISLSRAMRSLSIFIVLLGIATFFFSDTVIPYSYREFINLRRGVVKQKPARAIVANQFNQLGDISIKVSKKYGENDEFLEDVIIHKENPKHKGNYTVIKAESGELKSAINSNILTIALYNGHYYNDILPKKYKDKKKLPFVKSDFKEYEINRDFTTFDDVEVSENDYAKNRKMLNAETLSKDIDTFSTQINKSRGYFRDRMFTRSTGIMLRKDKKEDKKVVLKCKTEEYPDHILDIADYVQRVSILNEAKRDVKSSISRIDSEIKGLKKNTSRINKFEIALHEKYALAFGCIVLFFLGAPIGAIIRKGGLGLPFLYAIGLFLVYYFSGIFAKNSAEDGSISPFLATWLSTLIFTPLGIIFTYQATTDKKLINFDPFFVWVGKLFPKKKTRK